MSKTLGVLSMAVLFAGAFPAVTLAVNPKLTLQQSTNGFATWQKVPLTPDMLSGDGEINLPTATNSAFYRLQVVTPAPIPAGMVLIPAGTFSMGNSLLGTDVGQGDEVPVHVVGVGAFYMDTYEVTKARWDEVRAWGLTNGYTDLPEAVGKASDHPVQNINWYDAVKWSNARSEKEGLLPCYTVSSAVYRTGESDSVACNFSANGYRLPTEAEWEKAARGGLSGVRMPWGNTITHSQANYYSISIMFAGFGGWGFDLGPTDGFHPTYAIGDTPYTAPVGSFAANGYGLYDMAGNVAERCWDWYDGSYYASSPTIDPLGAPSGVSRVIRGGSWNSYPSLCRVADRAVSSPGNSEDGVGFRCVVRR